MVGHENKSIVQYILQDATSKFLLLMECLDNIILKPTLVNTSIKSRFLSHRANSLFIFKTTVSFKSTAECNNT